MTQRRTTTALTTTALTRRASPALGWVLGWVCALAACGWVSQARAQVQGDGVSVRLDGGLYYPVLMGEASEVLDTSPLPGFRLLLGGQYAWLFGGVTVAATPLMSDEIDLGITGLWLISLGTALGLDVPLWTSDDGKQRVGLSGRGEVGWATLDQSAEGFGHSGLTYGWGGGVFYSHRDGGAAPLAFSLWLDALWARPMLDHPLADRRIYGDTLSIGLGATISAWSL